MRPSDRPPLATGGMRAALREAWLPAIASAALAATALLVDTETLARTFAHPARVALAGGRIPEATVLGAQCFRVALLGAGVLLPVLSIALARSCARAGTRTARPTRPTRRADWWMLGGAVAAGALLRVAWASQSLWYDEISAFLSFAIEGPGVAFGSYAVPTNHVPMTIATWAAWALSGGSLAEPVLRAPAIVAGIAAIPAGWALCDTLFGRRAAALGAWTVALAPIAVLESTEARGYAFVILAALVAALALARAARTGAVRDHALFAIATALGAWAHPVAILLPFAAGLVGLVRDRRLAIAALISGTTACLLLSPLVGDVLATRADYARTDAAQPAALSREGYEALVGLTLSWSDAWLALPNPLLLAVTACGGAALALSRTGRFARARRVLAPFALAFVLAFAISALLGTWIYARFVLFALPLGVVAAAALPSAVRAARRRRALRVALACVVAGSLTGLASYTTKQPIREAVAFVDAARAPDDRVAAIGLPDNAVAFYTRQSGFDATPTGFLGDRLADVVARDRPRFVIALYPDRLDAKTLATLDGAYDRVDRLEGWADWGAGAVEVWMRPQESLRD